MMILVWIVVVSSVVGALASVYTRNVPACLLATSAALWALSYTTSGGC